MAVTTRGALLGAALMGMTLASPALAADSGESTAEESIAPRAQAPPPASPTLAGDFRTKLRVKSGGKPFGQSRGDTVTRTWTFKERCRKASPCDRVRLIRKGRKGSFGSFLRRRDKTSWRGVEKVRGRCGDGRGFTSSAVIELTAVDYLGGSVAEFTGTFDASVHGCLEGGERAVFRGRAG